MDFERLGCEDLGDFLELVVGVIVIVAYIIGEATGHINTPNWLLNLVVVSAVTAIFGDKVYKRMKGKNNG